MRSVNYEPFKLSVVMLNVVMLNVVMLNVVAPTGEASVSFIDIRVTFKPFESNNKTLA